MKLGNFLLIIMFWIGMSRDEVAVKCNISISVLNDIIENKRSINIGDAKSFEELFGIPALVWLTWSNIDGIKNSELVIDNKG